MKSSRTTVIAFITICGFLPITFAISEGLDSNVTQKFDLLTKSGSYNDSGIDDETERISGTTEPMTSVTKTISNDPESNNNITDKIVIKGKTGISDKTEDNLERNSTELHTLSPVPVEEQYQNISTTSTWEKTLRASLPVTLTMSEGLDSNVTQTFDLLAKHGNYNDSGIENETERISGTTEPITLWITKTFSNDPESNHNITDKIMIKVKTGISDKKEGNLERNSTEPHTWSVQVEEQYENISTTSKWEKTLRPLAFGEEAKGITTAWFLDKIKESTVDMTLEENKTESSSTESTTWWMIGNVQNHPKDQTTSAWKTTLRTYHHANGNQTEELSTTEDLNLSAFTWFPNRTDKEWWINSTIETILTKPELEQNSTEIPIWWTEHIYDNVTSFAWEDDRTYNYSETTEPEQDVTNDHHSRYVTHTYHDYGYVNETEHGWLITLLNSTGEPCMKMNLQIIINVYFDNNGKRALFIPTLPSYPDDFVIEGECSDNSSLILVSWESTNITWYFTQELPDNNSWSLTKLELSLQNPAWFEKYNFCKFPCETFNLDTSSTNVPWSYNSETQCQETTTIPLGLNRTSLRGTIFLINGFYVELFMGKGPKFITDACQIYY